MITGIFTAILIVCFCGIVGWAYSSRRKGEFDLMASVPLIDDDKHDLETRP
jgi:cytochrome c oxidase cbb3-type subunit 4